MDTEHNERARELWQRAKRILDEILDAEPGERLPLLQLRCVNDPDLRREVEELLAAEAEMATAEFIEKPAVSLRDLAPEPSLVGEQLGPYEVIEEIGRGGMGSVYLAVRKGEFERRVALKVIRRGFDTETIVRRFRNERQILANLEHPNIARLYDGASTADGRPYLVMEHVEGEAIDRYCDQRHLTTRERLELICKVCDAVQAAHQNLVVHRDIKPSNILVTADGEPRLLDFGIAKLVSLEEADLITQMDGGPKAFTPEYASPEQVTGSAITTSSDVYSLGVLLYEVLTGHRPYEFPTLSPVEISHIICEQQPSQPSTVVNRTVQLTKRSGTVKMLTPESVSRTRDGDPRILRRRLAGDVDAIVLKALRKEPDQRYGTAAELAKDIRRHLRGLPVRARKGTTTYRAGKFFRRRWKEVAAAAIVFVLVGFAGIQALARQKGEEQRESLLLFLDDALEQADTSRTTGEVPTLVNFLDASTQIIEQHLPEQPEVKAAFLGRMGRIYARAGSFDPALNLLHRSEEIRREEKGRNLPSSLLNLAITYEEQRDLVRAEEYAIEAHGLLRSRSDEESRKLDAKALSMLGGISVARGQFEQAAQLQQSVLDIKRDLYGPRSPDTGVSYNNVGEVWFSYGDYLRAAESFRTGLEILKDPPPDFLVNRASLLGNLGLTQTFLGNLVEGEQLLRDSLDLRKQLAPDNWHRIANAETNLGLNLQLQLRNQEAEELQRSALEKVGGVEEATPKIVRNLADILLQLGNLQEAEIYAQAAVNKSSNSKSSQAFADAQSLLGEIVAEQDRMGEAIPLLNESWQTLSDSPLLTTAIEVRRARARMIRYGLLEEEPEKDRPAMPTQV